MTRVARPTGERQPGSAAVILDARLRFTSRRYDGPAARQQSWVVGLYLRARQERRLMNILIVGAGTVGLATGRGLASLGHRITYVEKKPETLTALLNQGERAVYSEERDVTPTLPFDVAFLALATPNGENGYELTALREGCHYVAGCLRLSQNRPVVAVRSTVLPGTTEGPVRHWLEESGRRAFEEFGLAVNPEFLRAARAENDFLRPRSIIIGRAEAWSAVVLRRLYRGLRRPVLEMPIAEAELAKLAANLFNAAKISFFNELRAAAATFGVGTDAAFGAAALVAEGLWNPAYGTRDIGPFDGACLPKDLAAFIAATNGDAPLLAAVQEVNRRVTREES